MDALSISQFAILKIKDLSYTSWILSQLPKEKPAKKYLIFSEKLSASDPENPLFLKTFPLKDFTQKRICRGYEKKERVMEESTGMA